ncbi:hypothetical protein J1N35_011096 [Gossypium stocksii]|uniref:Uncharacterized protein n=1 Tax=Gossypium stocksii TaxID=47602 RepID=A0A9D3W3L4_9ROSI|nr:hypothetical protein J1N35_011096 [Gossypium stocksii]
MCTREPDYVLVELRVETTGLTVDQNDPCGPRKNFRIMGPHTRVTHTAWPRIHTPVWHARVAHTPSLAQPIWPTQPCRAHDHAFVDHTAMSSPIANHTARHTPVWRQQNGFLAFVETRFSAFRVHI